MKEVQKITEVYRVDTESEARDLIEEEIDAASKKGYCLTKTESKYKTKKAKGAIIEDWYLVTIEKDFCN